MCFKLHFIYVVYIFVYSVSYIVAFLPTCTNSKFQFYEWSQHTLMQLKCIVYNTIHIKRKLDTLAERFVVDISCFFFLFSSLFLLV